MSKFKVGDKVKAISATYRWGRVTAGDVGIVRYNHGEDLQVDFPMQRGWYCDEGNLELAEDTSKHRKHHDLIIQWAKGAEVEIYSLGKGWVSIKYPNWTEGVDYRIKPPSTKSDKERIAELEEKVKKLEGI